MNEKPPTGMTKYTYEDGSKAYLKLVYDPNHTVEIELHDISPHTYHLITGYKMPYRYQARYYRTHLPKRMRHYAREWSSWTKRIFLGTP